MKKIHRYTLIFLAALSAPTSHGAEPMGIAVHDSWVREMPPVASTTAAYMMIENESAKPQVLMGAQSSLFERVELHRTVEEGGVASMVKQEQVEIAPGATLKMEPGGYHVMLIGFKQPLKAGDEVPLVLQFEGGATKALSVPVTKSAGGGGHHHHH